jgi:hypothetical protein
VNIEDIEDIDYVEFFEVGNKIDLLGDFGVVVQTYDLDEDNLIVGGDLIVSWDSKVEADYESCSGNLEPFIVRLEEDYEFTYINDDGTDKIKTA